MAPVLATMPLQVMCQLVMSAIPRCDNTSIDVNILTAPIKPDTLPPGFIAYPEMDAAYKFYDVNVSWLTARKLCIAEGAQLAVIDTPKKLKFVTDQNPKTGNYVHVGIHSFFEKNDWVSVKDGAPVSTLQWNSGYPSGDHRCVMALSSGLENYDCNLNRHYMCELPIPKS